MEENNILFNPIFIGVFVLVLIIIVIVAIYSAAGDAKTRKRKRHEEQQMQSRQQLKSIISESIGEQITPQMQSPKYNQNPQAAILKEDVRAIVLEVLKENTKSEALNRPSNFVNNDELKQMIKETLTALLMEQDFTEKNKTMDVTTPPCIEKKQVDDNYDILKKNGIKIYSWERQCWKCKGETRVYTYFLDIDLNAKRRKAASFSHIGVGYVEEIDNILHNMFPTVKLTYSSTTKTKYMANTCVNCSALQGRNYVVDDPHEIWPDLISGTMDLHVVEVVNFDDTGITRQRLDDILL